MMRIAISPRLAMRIFLNMGVGVSFGTRGLLCPYRKETLAVLDGLTILNVDVDDLAVVFRVDLVHQLHRLDDAEDVALLHRRADLDERGRSRLGRAIEGADDRRLYHRQLDLRVAEVGDRGGAPGGRRRRG